jgi:hypothetical protein
MKRAKKFITTILIIIGVLFSYGICRGIYDANYNSESSLLSIGMTINGMNPISKYRYKLGIHTNPKIQKRIDDFGKSSEKYNNY